jgi:hypothetical protein
MTVETSLWCAGGNLAKGPATVVRYPNAAAIEEDSLGICPLCKSSHSRTVTVAYSEYRAVGGVIAYPDVTTIKSEQLWILSDLSGTDDGTVAESKLRNRFGCFIPAGI